LSEQPDIHARLMSRYKQVPEWWVSIWHTPIWRLYLWWTGGIQ
jgi:hypothetical protein